MQVRSIFIAMVTASFLNASSSAATVDDELASARRRLSPQAVNAFFERHRYDVTSDGLSVLFGLCDPDAGDNDQCEYNRALLALQIPFAYRGSYVAQRNIAFCLIEGCNGAVVRSYLLGCAWRIVIVASGSPRVSFQDIANVQSCGERLDTLSRKSTRRIAEALVATIYESRLPMVRAVVVDKE